MKKSLAKVRPGGIIVVSADEDSHPLQGDSSVANIKSTDYITRVTRKVTKIS